MKKILFVCTGNTCRSPMAEGLFRKMVVETRQEHRYEIASAGLSACRSTALSEGSAEFLAMEGADLPTFQSQPVERPLLNWATHVFAMTRSHLAQLERRFPEFSAKFGLMTEFLPEDHLRNSDIEDPFGGSQEDYFEAGQQIAHCLRSIKSFLDASPDFSPMNTTTKLAIAADHGGFALKESLVTALKGMGHEVLDLGVQEACSVDYPDYADEVCEAVLQQRVETGILICTTGIGMSIAANRHPGIQASLVTDVETARMTRQHNDSNVLCLSARDTSAEEAVEIAKAWLSTPFSGEDRHERRVAKMNQPPGSLAHVDPDIFHAIQAESRRQANNIELIASENFTSRAVREAQGSVLTNKYAEGYPGKRWYGGCEEVDKVEQLAIDRLCQLFGAKYANVQPHSGSQANTAVYFAFLQPGDRILTMDLSHGGHLTHGHKANFSGRFYEVKHYGVSPQDERIDYDDVLLKAKEFQPKMITAGASAYPRTIDFEKMSAIAKEVGAVLFVDMAHIAGLVAAGVHPSPIPYADVVASTTHKSLRGPRGGFILCNDPEIAKKINAQVFPGIQGGPLMHVIAGKAVCFHEALQPEFKNYQQQIVKNAAVLAAELSSLGYRLVSGGTDNHLMLLDLRPQKMNGMDASEALDKAGITINKNSIPFDTASPMKPSGIRIGTPAVTTRGMKEKEMKTIAQLIHRSLVNRKDEAALAAIRREVEELTVNFSLP